MSLSRPKSVVTVIVVGLGSVGAYAASLVARTLGWGVVVLVDKGRCGAGNPAGQAIRRGDIGRTKVEVIGRRLRRLNPALKVIAHAAAVEDLPLGMLRGTILLGCVDTRRTRLYLAETSWVLGVCYIDSRIEPDGLLARVSTYIPGSDSPCYQCGWQQSDYDAVVAETHPSSGTTTPQAVTNGLASLGSLAASLQVIECHKILSGRPARTLNGEELLWDAARQEHQVTARARSRHCRFAHQTWRLQSIPRDPGKLTLAEVFALASPDHGNRPGPYSRQQPTRPEMTLRAPGHEFVRMLTCRRCSHRQRVLRLVRRHRPTDRECTRCKLQEMVPLVGDMSGRLVEGSLSAADLSRPLRSLGFVAGDVFTITWKVGESVTERHFVLEPQPSRTSTPRGAGADARAGPAVAQAGAEADAVAGRRSGGHGSGNQPTPAENRGPVAGRQPEPTTEVCVHGQANAGFLGAAVPGGDGPGRRE